jgi:hypothetical protein
MSETGRSDGEDTRRGGGWHGDIGGCVPVQGFGRLDGLPWYFRARYETWSFRLADTVDGDPVAVQPGRDGSGWYVEREYDGDLFAAGYMSTDEAWGFVAECIEAHRAGTLSRVEAST